MKAMAAMPMTIQTTTMTTMEWEESTRSSRMREEEHGRIISAADENNNEYSMTLPPIPILIAAPTIWYSYYFRKPGEIVSTREYDS